MITLKTQLLLIPIFVSALAASAQTQLENILSPSRLPYLKNSKLIQISSHDTTGGNNDFIVIKNGETAVIADIQGPGIITQLWVTIFSKDKFFLRRIVLRMFWDGEENPSVEVPVGDFFGTGFQYKQYVMPFIGMSSGGYYSYFPMPFNNSARIEVVNQTGQEIISFYYHIDYHKLQAPLEPDVAYFHAQWRRQPRTNQKENYTILEAEGKGHIVGMNMSMQSYNSDMQFLEGDEMVYVDGEKYPSIYGTGTEDYFNSGWYFNRGEFAAPYHGLILKDDSLARIAAYRFHILDAVPFTKSVRFTIEHGDQNVEIADYSSTAYWYQLEPHKEFPELPAPGLRIPLRVAVPNGTMEAESLSLRQSNLKSQVEDMSAFGADWSGMKQLKVLAQRERDEFSLALPVPEERYDVAVYLTQGPDYGDADIFHRGKNVGKIRGFSKTTTPGGKVVLKNLSADRQKITLRFVVKGKEKKSIGYAVGLDAFVLEPHRKYIPEWYMIGPFPNERDANLKRMGLDSVYPPETEIDLKKTYVGVDQQPVRWTLDQTPANGRMDLYKYDPYELVVVYALTYISSPRDQTVPLLLGTDDGVKVFLNDVEIHRVLKIRVAEPDQDRVPLALKKGWNKLLLKIENNFGGYNFYARMLDPEGALRFGPDTGKR
ncbi:MAG: DUF2961 domain-containing protein [Ignavibacteriae bacterium]|nr:DUF2961 domain-containing protein [Ignavibacteriota bacterium]